MDLTRGFSPCPNDTFIFDGLFNGTVPLAGHTLEVVLLDVETLNRMAFEEQLDITKISFFAWLAVRDRYRLLDCGGVLGFGCGPMVIARRLMARQQGFDRIPVLAGPGEPADGELVIGDTALQGWFRFEQQRKVLDYGSHSHNE